MPYDWAPTHFDGVSLTAAPFSLAPPVFDALNGPPKLQTYQAIESAIVDLGSRFVRGQPEPAVWELHVFLDATDEAQLETLRRTFSPERGLVFLRADDGDAVNWRVACFVVGVDRLDAPHWLIRLYVPDPAWEENAATTSTQPNITTNPFDFVVTNNGDRLARPVVTFAPDAVQLDPAMDFTISFRGWVANRSPFALVDVPVMLLDFNHAAKYSVGASTRLVNQVGGITATAAIIPYDTTAGAWLTPGGFGLIDNEQFYYDAFDGVQFSGCVRGVGGTVAATHADNAVITRSDALFNGEDIRVFAEGEEIESHVAGLRTSSCRVWAPMSMPARRLLHTSEAWTASAPADGGEALFDEGVADVPDDGVFFILNSSNELVSYTSRDVAAGKLKGLNRETWFTAAGTSAAGVACYLVSHPQIVVAMGRRSIGGTNAWPAGSVTPPPAPRLLDRRPAFQLGNSNNSQWRYGDTASDPDTVFFDPDRPDRPASFVPVSEIPAGDKNDAAGLRLETALARAGWTADVPVAGKPDTPRLSLHTPVGIEAVASGIVYDAQQRRNVRLRILGRDATGFETELANKYDVAEALVTAQAVTPAKVLHELILNAVRSATTGSGRGVPGGGFDLQLEGQFYATRFTLTNDTKFKAVQIALKGAGAFRVGIYDTSGASPFEGSQLVQFVHSSQGTGPSFAINLSAITIIEYRNDAVGEMLLPAGTHWLLVALTVDATTPIEFGGLGIGADVKWSGYHSQWHLNSIPDDVKTLGATDIVGDHVNGALSAVATSIPVKTTAGQISGPGLFSSGRAWIEDDTSGNPMEKISYSGRSKTDLTGVVRGIEGTAAVAHADGKRIIQADETGAPAFWFRFVHEGAGPIQEEAGALVESGEAYIDNLILELNDAAADPFTPLVAGIEVATYHLNGELKNVTNGKGFALDFWCPLQAQGGGPVVVTIDAERRTAKFTQGSWTLAIAGAVTPLNDSDWLPLEPGANTLRWTEAAPSLDIVATFRGKKG